MLFNSAGKKNLTSEKNITRNKITRYDPCFAFGPYYSIAYCDCPSSETLAAQAEKSRFSTLYKLMRLSRNGLARSGSGALIQTTDNESLKALYRVSVSKPFWQWLAESYV
jgi:hypothetical protein